jgi:hypothetical protein
VCFSLLLFVFWGVAEIHPSRGHPGSIISLFGARFDDRQMIDQFGVMCVELPC